MSGKLFSFFMLIDQKNFSRLENDQIFFRFYRLCQNPTYMCSENYSTGMLDFDAPTSSFELVV